MEFDRTRLRLSVSMGCIIPGLKVAACLFRAERGNSFENAEPRTGDEANVVSWDEESDGFPLPKNPFLSCWFWSWDSKARRRPF